MSEMKCEFTKVIERKEARKMSRHAWRMNKAYLDQYKRNVLIEREYREKVYLMGLYLADLYATQNDWTTYDSKTILRLIVMARQHNYKGLPFLFCINENNL